MGRASMPSLYLSAELNESRVSSGGADDLDERVDPRLDVRADLLHGRPVVARGEGNDQVDLRAEADLREPLILTHDRVLVELERHDAVDVVIGDLQQVVIQAEVGRVDAV